MAWVVELERSSLGGGGGGGYTCSAWVGVRTSLIIVSQST